MNLIMPVSSILGAADTAVHVLHRDFESRSTLDLRKVGGHKYAGHSDTAVYCCAYAVDDGCSCGFPAIQCRRNGSKPRAIPSGSRSRTMTNSKP
jgi:hypothetical protein